ncbi:barstar family protein [Streptomyces sp. NPDC096311]|uniref:barstar family protein n=1 Tax=Streptomyces sp. NPDC096311 TaxID=3366083 RepID=UPI0038298A02
MTDNTPHWIRPLTEAAAGTPSRAEVRGSHSRTSRALFTEWAAVLGFPDYFGHNWDAFLDSLHDLVPHISNDEGDQGSSPPLTVVVREAGDLLADEPPNVLATLLNVLSEAAGDDSATPRLVLLVDDTPDRLSHLARRMAEIGHPPAFGTHR